MKKSFLSSLALAALLVSFTSCKDNAKADEASSSEDTTEEVVVVEEEVVVEEATEDTETEAEATPATGSTKVSGGSTDNVELTEDGSNGDVKDTETVEVVYSYTVMGKVLTGSKTFSGHQDEVEASVKKLEDSLTKIDPNLKISTK
ncbi:hypothetical protein F6U93_06680 [Tamlana haliotis]|uniref:Uncharacterized protein n=1 Tax=Pseudotamlana haliotis TaxID=2614804 RepID=A0A6N6MHD5_9FLAO|nr:hypothetical protein [Tamlana haliotis]KAB1068380.1 hypothetical protein F6U93_06680 [Tamlana haliotis]